MKKITQKSLSIKMRLFTRVRTFIIRHKKLVIISVGLTIVLIVAGWYIWWSLAAWSGIESRSIALRQSVLTHMDVTIVLPVGSDDEKAKKLRAFDAINQQITSYQSVCDVSGFIVWQHTVQAFKDRENACHANLAQLDPLQTSLVAMTNYLRDEKAVAAPIKIVGNGAADSNETSWQQTATGWRVVADELKKLKVSSEFEPVLARTVTEAEHVNTSWQEVVNAHVARDRARFEKAEDELSKAYGSLKDITQLDSKTLKPLLTQLESNYLALKSQ